MKIKAGLTGNIGSGKTILAGMIRAMGYPVYDSDRQAKQLYFRRDVKDEVRKAFGDKVFDANGMLIRSKLAEIVFPEPRKLKTINEIIHPRVLEGFHEWSERQKSKLVFQESAVLFESGFYRFFDHKILVVAPLELRIQRVMTRDQASRQQVLDRMQNQWSEDEKRKHADHIINNDENHLLVPQLLGLMKKIEPSSAAQSFGV